MVNMSNGQSVGKKVGSELKGIVGDAVKGVAEAGKDVVKGVVGEESVTNGSGDDKVQKTQGLSNQSSSGMNGQMAKTAKQQQKEVARKRRLDELRAELEQYREKKKQEELQEGREQEQEVVEKEQKKKEKMTKREQMVFTARRDRGGTREMARKKH